jgi:isocitrate lyase
LRLGAQEPEIDSAGQRYRLNEERKSMTTIEAAPQAGTPFEQDVAATQRYFDSPRFDGIIRLYTARQVVEQRGTIAADYIVAREAATAFFARLRELFGQHKSITTFGPYSPGQAVTMKRNGIEGIYLGGWATSAKGSISEDPGPDLASYPLSQVPDDRCAACQHAGGRLPAVHHRRRRYRPRWRSARPQPDPSLRGVRRARVPHRGPAPGHQEVRSPGRQGSGAVG